MKKELRVFYNLFELDRDYRNFINSSICDVAFERDKRAIAGEWQIKWVWSEQANGPTSHIAGLCFERIQCDMRINPNIQRYLLTRLRSIEYKIEPLISFHEYPWNIDQQSWYRKVIDV